MDVTLRLLPLRYSQRRLLWARGLDIGLAASSRALWDPTRERYASASKAGHDPLVRVRGIEKSSPSDINRPKAFNGLTDTPPGRSDGSQGSQTQGREVGGNSARTQERERSLGASFLRAHKRSFGSTLTLRLLQVVETRRAWEPCLRPKTPVPKGEQNRGGGPDP